MKPHTKEIVVYTLYFLALFLFCAVFIIPQEFLERVTDWDHSKFRATIVFIAVLINSIAMNLALYEVPKKNKSNDDN